jgi:hypothetical protein
MTRTEAQLVVETLFRPFKEKDPDRIDAYVDALVDLQDMETALIAVKGVLAAHTGGWLPTIGQVREAYLVERRRAREAQPALPEPQLTPEQRAENIRRSNILIEHAAGNLDMDAALQELVEVDSDSAQ